MARITISDLNSENYLTDLSDPEFNHITGGLFGIIAVVVWGLAAGWMMADWTSQ